MYIVRNSKRGEKSLGNGKEGYAWKFSAEASVLSVNKELKLPSEVDMEGKVHEELMKVLCSKRNQRY